MNEPALIAAIKPKLLFLTIGGIEYDETWGTLLRSELPADVLIASYLPDIFADTNPRIKGTFQDAIRGRFLPDGAKNIGFVAFVPKSVLAKVKKLQPGKAVLSDVKEVTTGETERRLFHFGKRDFRSVMVQ